ncbi:MAG: MBOAT family protein [Oscillospiraceae bacterium]|jgi:alginate O-acetyltransferase complex protein AlgI|nr:MBOAT family protein [Oscillospiraceae bacterium]
MVFSSLTFLCFFLPSVIVLHTAFRSLRARNAVLLVFSLVFYAWGEPIWLLGMLFTTGLNYACALLLTRIASPRKRRFALFLAVAASLAFLVYFKYTAFAVNSLSALIGGGRVMEPLRLPLGISFYTFQAITYTADVYKGKCRAQSNPLLALLYIACFPQMIAGPIVRYADVAEKLTNRAVSADDAYRGFCRLIVGLSKKVLIANLCAEAIAALPASGGEQALSVAGSWLLMLLFAFQIYFDFSGYSDMGIGMGRMFGFKYPENFNYPYISASVTEFWRRWHMSLGAFFRDYVYIPLGGNRVPARRWVFNVMAVWLLTGLWHGASWNFVAWGAYYGLLLMAERFAARHIRLPVPKPLRVAVTMVFVLFGWALFYYESLPAGVGHIAAMLGLSGGGFADPAAVYVLKENALLMCAAALCCLPWAKPLARARAVSCLRPVFMSLLFALSFLFLVGQSFNPFLYFRF